MIEVPDAAVAAFQEALIASHACTWMQGGAVECARPKGHDGDHSVASGKGEWIRYGLAQAAPHIAAAALRRAAEEHHVVVAPNAVIVGAEPPFKPGAVRCSLCDRPAPCPAVVDLWERAAQMVPPTPDIREGILAALGLTEEDMERADG